MDEYEVTKELGLQIVAEAVRREREGPFIGAIYGYDNSGKRAFARSLVGMLEQEGIEMHAGLRPQEDDFRLIPKKSSVDAFLFHCTWPRTDFEVAQDPNVLAKTVLGRELDFNIGIYDSTRQGEFKGEYDVLIDSSLR